MGLTIGYISILTCYVFLHNTLKKVNINIHSRILMFTQKIIFIEIYR